MAETEPIELNEVQPDDFIKNLKAETERDGDPQPEPKRPDQEPKQEPKSKPSGDDDDSDLDELSNPALVTDILVEVVDLLHNIGMQALSGEPNADLFKVPAQGKKRIKMATQKLIEKYNWNLHPAFALVFLVLVVYGPTTVKAAGMRKLKIREKKKQKDREAGKEPEQEPIIEIKRGPGRPTGTKNKG